MKDQVLAKIRELCNLPKYMEKELQLYHVLQAIRDSDAYTLKSGYIAITPNGQFIDSDNEKIGTPFHWNLSEPLEGQPEEVYQFLAGVLIK